MRNAAAFGSVFDRIDLLAAAARIARIFGTTVVFFSTACQQKRGSAGACSGFTSLLGQPRDLAFFLFERIAAPARNRIINCLEMFCVYFGVAGFTRDAPRFIPNNYQAGKAHQATERIHKRLVAALHRNVGMFPHFTSFTCFFCFVFVFEIIQYAQ